jgi:hypothetical protein
MAEEVYNWTGIDIPWVRADWFVATASRPPLYHTLLYDAVFEDLARQPRVDVKLADGTISREPAMTAGDLERWLRVNVAANLRRNRAARAGFTKSGVSSQPRLIERHPALYGAYWLSYDFKQGNPTMNLLARPLGPAPLLNDPKFQPYHFRQDGGEIIFHLPNGLQGYLLVDGQGHRIHSGRFEKTVEMITGSRVFFLSAVRGHRWCEQVDRRQKRDSRPLRSQLRSNESCHAFPCSSSRWLAWACRRQDHRRHDQADQRLHPPPARHRRDRRRDRVAGPARGRAQAGKRHSPTAERSVGVCRGHAHPQGQSLVIPGWFNTIDTKRKDNFLRFLVTEYGQGAASKFPTQSQGQIGVVTVQISKSHLPGSGQAKSSAETGFGPPVQAELKALERLIDPPHDFISLRYLR